MPRAFASAAPCLGRRGTVAEHSGHRSDKKRDFSKATLRMSISSPPAVALDTPSHLAAAMKPTGVSASSTTPSPYPAVSPDHVPAIVRGIITHYVDPAMREQLRQPADHLRLVEDLGLDSLTLMEIMIKVEDILRVTVSDQELRHFRTLGDVRQFVVRSVGAAPMAGARPLTA